MMKLSFRATIIVLAIFAISSTPLAAENLFEIIEKAQKSINKKYPDKSSIARKMAIEELEKIARSDRSEEERIAAILATFPDPIEEMVRKAEQGDAEAQYKLGNCYCDGKEGLPQDYAEAVKWFRKAAEQGYAEAQFELGRCYAHGNSVKKNYAEAVKWFRKAAEQGNSKAQSNLAICFYNGIGVEKDYEESAKWCRKAAEQGDAKAQSNLGVIYYTGNGIKRDYSEAVKWFRKAAEQGDAGAQFNIGLCYHEGNGVSRNESEAFKWYRKASEQGHEDAKNKLAAIVRANSEKTKQSNEDALREQREIVEVLQFLNALSGQQQSGMQQTHRDVVCTMCGGLGYTFDGVMGTRKSCIWCHGTGYTSSQDDGF